MSRNSQKVTTAGGNGRRSRQAGLTLLECVMAMLVASIAMAGVAAALEAAAATVARTRQGWLAVDLARGVLENAIGSPCAQAYECPPQFQCELSRSWISSLSLERLSVSVTSRSMPAPVRLDSLLRAPACAPA
ncbi:MAG TPA: prepilin-type N-terminal cleavage/methylation domain-containing protein [Candidatus Binatia bacterium]|nr:prepilin-type N-terminal cleavage/methylation domain-containing protein [Candidatus Binatia bacterium]